MHGRQNSRALLFRRRIFFHVGHSQRLVGAAAPRAACAPRRNAAAFFGLLSPLPAAVCNRGCAKVIYPKYQKEIHAIEHEISFMCLSLF